MAWIRRAVHHVLDFDWQCASCLTEAMGEVLDMGYQGSCLGGRRLGFVERFGDDGEETGLVGEIAYLDPADALEDDLDVSGRLTLGGDNRHERTDVMKVFGARIVSVGITVSRHDQPSVRGQGVIDGPHRSGTPNEQGNNVAREDDDVLQRQERMPVLEPLPRIHGAHANVLCMRKSPSAGRIASVVRGRPRGQSRPLMVAGS